MNALGPAEVGAPSLAHVLQRNAESFPVRIGIITPDRSATYGELWSRAQRIAAYLESAGVGPGDRVAVLVENSAEWLEIAAGVSCRGCQLIALSTWVERWDLERLIASSEPEVLFVSSRVRDGAVAAILADLLPELKTPGERSFERFAGLRKVLEIGPGVLPGAASYQEAATGEAAFAPRAEPREAGLVLFSSGSTAMPKGVALVNEDVVVNAAAIGDRLGLTADDRLFVPMPFFWAFGGPNGLMAALTHGATVVTLDKFDAGPALELIEREQCTALYTMPNMTSALLNHPMFAQARVDSLEKGITVGTPSEVQVVIDELGASSVCNVYGCSELYANATVTPFDAEREDRLTTHGPALPGMRVQIIDHDTGKELTTGEVGEIHVSGRVAAGYLQSDGSLRSIVDDSGSFATGDLGFVDSRGWLTYVGRSTDMAKIRGINVSPVEVEEFLRGHPAVESVLVFGLDDPEVGQKLVALIVPKQDFAATEQTMRDWCAGKIASYKIPARVLIVDELPTTATGKISRVVARNKYSIGV